MRTFKSVIVNTTNFTKSWVVTLPTNTQPDSYENVNFNSNFTKGREFEELTEELEAVRVISVRSEIAVSIKLQAQVQDD